MCHFVERIVNDGHRAFEISHCKLAMTLVDLRLFHLVVLPDAQVTICRHCICIALDLELVLFTLLRCNLSWEPRSLHQT